MAVIEEQSRECRRTARLPRTHDSALHVEKKRLRRIKWGNQGVSLQCLGIVDRQPELDRRGFRFVLLGRRVFALAVDRLGLILSLGRLARVLRDAAPPKVPNSEGPLSADHPVVPGTIESAKTTASSSPATEIAPKTRRMICKPRNLMTSFPARAWSVHGSEHREFSQTRTPRAKHQVRNIGTAAADPQPRFECGPRSSE